MAIRGNVLQNIYFAVCSLSWQSYLKKHLRFRLIKNIIALRNGI